MIGGQSYFIGSVEVAKSSLGISTHCGVLGGHGCALRNNRIARHLYEVHVSVIVRGFRVCAS